MTESSVWTLGTFSGKANKCTDSAPSNIPKWVAQAQRLMTMKQQRSGQVPGYQIPMDVGWGVCGGDLSAEF